MSTAIIILWFRTPKASKPVAAELREKILQLDIPGSLILMCSIICLLLALQWGGTTKSWKNSDVIGTLIGFVLILLFFIAFEWYQGERALLLPRLIKQKTLLLMIIFISLVAGAFFILLYYLPIYFQSINGTSAAQSGIRNLPLILGVALFTIASGGLITMTGYYIPIMIVGSALASIGAGLIYTLDIGSPSSHWIGYQALTGIGLGLIFQIPIIVAQAVVPAEDVSSVTAIVLFFQTISGAIFITVAQTIFANQLLKTVAERVAGVDPGLVVATGATELRDTFNAVQLPGILSSYMAGLKDTYVVPIPLVALATFVGVAALVLDWRVLNKEDVMKAAGGA